MPIANLNSRRGGKWKSKSRENKFFLGGRIPCPPYFLSCICNVWGIKKFHKITMIADGSTGPWDLRDQVDIHRVIECAHDALSDG